MKCFLSCFSLNYLEIIFLNQKLTEQFQHIYSCSLSHQRHSDLQANSWQNNNVTNTGTMSTFTSLLIHQKEPAAKWELNSLWRSYNHLNKCGKIVLLNSTSIYSEDSYKTRNRGELLYSGKEYLLIPKKNPSEHNGYHWNVVKFLSEVETKRRNLLSPPPLNITFKVLASARK